MNNTQKKKKTTATTTTKKDLNDAYTKWNINTLIMQTNVYLSEIV